jgi:microcystin-dependent protein
MSKIFFSRVSLLPLVLSFALPAFAEPMPDAFKEEVMAMIVADRASHQVIPVGTILPYGGTQTLPEDYIECDGQQIRKSPGILSAVTRNFSQLYAVVGDAFTPLNERNTDLFRLPDLRGRATIGATQVIGSEKTEEIISPRNVGDKVGTETHSLSLQELPSHAHIASDSGHTHSATDSGHTHGYTSTGTQGGAPNLDRGGIYVNTRPEGTSGLGHANITVGSGNAVITVNPVGGSAPVSLMQPSLVVKYMIKWK